MSNQTIEPRRDFLKRAIVGAVILIAAPQITKSEPERDADFEEFRVYVEERTAFTKRNFDRRSEKHQREMIQILDDQYLRFTANNADDLVTNFILDFKNFLLRGVK